ncbi:pickpocket protein 28-like [Musca vetustissima]|uniref:pickpocket protein 28-like n=1 Tax=Musca vetustissima TaxID=27455 RepID=UPI002AB65926|nr:pickpocket protein 28-like [Musca vetustissima]
MAYPTQRGKLKRRKQLEIYCLGNLKKYLQETTLHGLKYLADTSLTNWEKLFFFIAFVFCFIAVVHLTVNIYAKWDSTPVMIGISPQPTSIEKLPLPALVLCNMNQVMYSKVVNYTKGSKEDALLQYLCYSEIAYDSRKANSKEFKNNDLELANFIIAVSIGEDHETAGIEVKLFISAFATLLSYDGCLYNRFRGLQLHFRTLDGLKTGPDVVPVDWNPEMGYPSNLPPKYYPRSTLGTGISMGVSVILNAEVDEYYCSTSNSAGFKVNLGTPIDRPLVGETGVIVPLGATTSFRIDAQISQSSPAIRSINRRRRRCVFLNEESLVFYRYYTKTHCEYECLSAFLIERCGCIPLYMPVIYANATFWPQMISARLAVRQPVLI